MASLSASPTLVRLPTCSAAGLGLLAVTAAADPEASDDKLLVDMFCPASSDGVLLLVLRLKDGFCDMGAESARAPARCWGGVGCSGTMAVEEEVKLES